MSVRIVVDSTANMPESLLSQVTVVPLNVSFGDETFIDGVTIDNKTFYEKLATSNTLPKTSQPSPAAFAAVYEEAKQTGDTLVVLCVSSLLSGTCQSAMIAAQDYENVYVVDTLHVANAFGVLAEYALQLANDGKSAQEIVDAVLAEREHVQLFALLDTLEYLEKGGRISKTAAFAGTLLSLKPIVCIRGGVLEMLGKARGSKQGNNLLCTSVQKTGVDFTRPVMLGYTGLDNSLLKKYIQDSADLWEGNCTSLPYALIGSVIGTHVGPGAIAVAYIEQN